MVPGPAPTLLDLIMAGGCLGFLLIALLVFGLPISLLVLARAKRRKTAILVPTVLSALAVLLAATSVLVGYAGMRAHVAAIEAEGGVVSPAEIADAAGLIWFTGGQGGVVCLVLLCAVGLAVITKRDRESETPAAPESTPPPA